MIVEENEEELQFKLLNNDIYSINLTVQDTDGLANEIDRYENSIGHLQNKNRSVAKKILAVEERNKLIAIEMKEIETRLNLFEIGLIGICKKINPAISFDDGNELNHCLDFLEDIVENRSSSTDHQSMFESLRINLNRNDLFDSNLFNDVMLQKKPILFGSNEKLLILDDN